jgi:hypothetical protein
MNLKFWERGKSPPPKLLPAGQTVRQTAEERFGVFCAPDEDGHPIFTDYYLGNPARRRDSARTERTIAIHWWQPDITKVFEYVDEISLLSLAIPKDSEEFDLQQERVRLGSGNQRLWHLALKTWAFPQDDMEFGRTSILWTLADRMIPENAYQRTASAYGIIPEWHQTASVINSALLGNKIEFLDSYTPGNQLSKTMVHNITWGSNNGKVHDDTYSIGPTRRWGIWVVMVKQSQLYRLMRRPYDVLVHAIKEYPVDKTPQSVLDGEKSDFFVTLFVRAEERIDTVKKEGKTVEVSSLKGVEAELRSIARATLRLTGNDLVEAFQAFVPGSPPPRKTYGMQCSLFDTEWQDYLTEITRHNNVAHAITTTEGGAHEKRTIYLGKAAPVIENPDGTIDLANQEDGPSVFLDTADFSSLGMIDVSGEGKTTYELFLFLQRFGPFAIIMNLAPGVNEAGEYLVRNFDPENPSQHVKVLTYDAQKHSEKEAESDGERFALDLLRQAELTGSFPVSPLYITTSNRSPLAHTWMESFLKTFRQGWGKLSQVGDETTGTKSGIFAGQTLGLMFDNVSSAKTHGALLLELEDIANNGKNQNIQSDHLSHTEEGLPRSYTESLAYRVRVWKVGNYFIYRFYKKDGKPLTPYINGTMPEFMWNWFARRDNVNAREPNRRSR